MDEPRGELAPCVAELREQGELDPGVQSASLRR